MPLTSAAVTRPGSDVTVLAYGTMVSRLHRGGRGAGIDAEVIDLRSLWPLDLAPIVGVGEEDRPLRDRPRATRTSGFGAELAALVQEHCFYHLESADRARDRVGHAVPARAGMGLLPRPGACRRRRCGGSMEA